MGPHRRTSLPLLAAVAFATGSLALAGTAAANPALAHPGRPAPQLSPQVAPTMRELVRIAGVRAFIRPAPHVRTVVTSTPLGVFYQPERLARIERRHGLAAVAGLLARELGHIRRGHPSYGRQLTALQQRAADEDAGCMLGRLQLDVRPLLRAQAQLNGGRLVRSFGPRSGHVLRAAAARCAVGAPAPAVARAPQAATRVTSPAPVARAPRAVARAPRSAPGPVDSVTGHPLVKPGSINAAELANRAGGDEY